MASVPLGTPKKHLISIFSEWERSLFIILLGDLLYLRYHIYEIPKARL